LYPYRETFYFNANKVRLYFKNILKKKNMPTEKLSQKFGKRRCGGEDRLFASKSLCDKSVVQQSHKI